MWQNFLCHCVVFTKASEEFAPYYLAEIPPLSVQSYTWPWAPEAGADPLPVALVARLLERGVARTASSCLHLRQRRLRLGEPEGHLHVAVQRDGRG